MRQQNRIPEKENRTVEAEKIPVALFGVEFHGESSRISHCVRATTLKNLRSLLTLLVYKLVALTDSGKPNRYISLFANFGKWHGFRVFSYIFGAFEITKGS